MSRPLNLLRIPFQVALLAAIWWLADIAVRTLHIPLPANLTGMLMLLLLIVLGVVRPHWFRDGANWLLAEMLLFFVPAMLVVTEYPDLIRHQGLRILAVIVTSTACVMAATALAVDRVYRFELWLARRRSSRETSAPGRG